MDKKQAMNEGAKDARVGFKEALPSCKTKSNISKCMKQSLADDIEELTRVMDENESTNIYLKSYKQEWNRLLNTKTVNENKIEDLLNEISLARKASAVGVSTVAGGLGGAALGGLVKFTSNRGEKKLKDALENCPDEDCKKRIRKALSDIKAHKKVFGNIKGMAAAGAALTGGSSVALLAKESTDADKEYAKGPVKEIVSNYPTFTADEVLLESIDYRLLIELEQLEEGKLKDHVRHLINKGKYFVSKKYRGKIKRFKAVQHINTQVNKLRDDAKDVLNDVEDDPELHDRVMKAWIGDGKFIPKSKSKLKPSETPTKKSTTAPGRVGSLIRA